MYAKIVSGVVEKFPYTQSDLLQDHPDTSFPQNMSDRVLEAHGMYKVRLLPEPSCDPVTQKAVKNDLPELSEYQTEWVLGWHIRQKTDEEKAQYLSHLANQAVSLRNQLLQDSDWIVAVAYEKGDPVSPAWAEYRQALRDVPQQEGFPVDIIWPTKPE
jgi:hypothetical protein